MKEMGSIIKKKNGELSIFANDQSYNLMSFDALDLDSLHVEECGWQVKDFRDINEENRNYYVIHYIVKGKGYFIAKGKKYTLGAYMGFILPPGESVKYWPDEKEPWQYYWVGVSGSLVNKLIKSYFANKEDLYVFTSAYKMQIVDIFAKMCIACNTHNRMVVQMQVMGSVYELFSYLFQDTITPNKTEHTVEKIVNYINMNYQTVTVQELSAAFFMHRSNLFKIFKKEMGCPMMQYIINLKIKKAMLLLKDTSMTIEEIASATGFQSGPSFCYQFKNKMKTTPSRYRKDPSSVT